MLMPGQPSETGPKSEGWVEVIENNISFGFDITRVMFCSGNCTERMRMGREVRIRFPLGIKVIFYNFIKSSSLYPWR